MTRISLLEDQRAIFTAQKEELENKRSDIYVREQQAISDALSPFFSDFTPEVEIEVLRGSVYFRMAHPDYSYKKELFNIYLRENWKLPFKEEYSRVYDQMNLIGQAIRELDIKIVAIKKERIEFDLKSEGITFGVGCNIQLKFNYTPYIKSIKLVELSKSGKKGTAVFEFQSGHSSREENCNVNSIIDQVLGFAKNIIQPVLAE